MKKRDQGASSDSVAHTPLSWEEDASSPGAHGSQLQPRSVPLQQWTQARLHLVWTASLGGRGSYGVLENMANVLKSKPQTYRELQILMCSRCQSALCICCPSVMSADACCCSFELMLTAAASSWFLNSGFITHLKQQMTSPSKIAHINNLQKYYFLFALKSIVILLSCCHIIFHLPCSNQHDTWKITRHISGKRNKHFRYYPCQ